MLWCAIVRNTGAKTGFNTGSNTVKAKITSRITCSAVTPAIASMSITQNKKARFDYFIEENHEAGLVLEGWEVKAIRAGRAQINEAYVIARNGAFWLLNAHISPLPAASTHVQPEPTRLRKLLLGLPEIMRLIGKVEQRGYSLVPLDLHYRNGRIKLEIGLGKGKLKGDKRQTEKAREWTREKQRLLKTASR